MRRALGLAGQQHTALPPHSTHHPGRPRRRFVRDGEVPVVLVTGRREREAAGMATPGAAPVNRLEILENALTAALQARHQAERSLAEAQAAIRDLQTKLGHSEVARQEAVTLAQTARHEAEIALAAERDGRRKAEEALRRALVDRVGSDDRGRAAVAPDAAPVRKPREPQPVKWWLHSKKAGRRASQ